MGTLSCYFTWPVELTSLPLSLLSVCLLPLLLKCWRFPSFTSSALFAAPELTLDSRIHLTSNNIHNDHNYKSRPDLLFSTSYSLISPETWQLSLTPPHHSQYHCLSPECILTLSNPSQFLLLMSLFRQAKSHIRISAKASWPPTYISTPLPERTLCKTGLATFFSYLSIIMNSQTLSTTDLLNQNLRGWDSGRCSSNACLFQ